MTVPGSRGAALSAPIRELLAQVGVGHSGSAARDPGVVLGEVRDSLVAVAADGRRAWAQTDGRWTGAAADAAAESALTTARAADELADAVGRLAGLADSAAAAVQRARARLLAILERFEARAAELEAGPQSPETAEQLAAEARRALAEATAVVDCLRDQLDEHAAGLPTAAPVAAPTVPAGFSAAGVPAGPTGPAGGGAPWAGPAGLGPVPASDPGHSPPPAGLDDAPVALADPAAFGDGVAVRLPDGSTATAPNPVAASAVRHALTQLGVPYRWGGTTPGVGLDCSGLTQWAYHEAGLQLPRLAQEQDIGAAVGRGALRPGDLAVWDGHVAMIVGNGQMIEAGDPVQLSPIRTTNAGQGFQGFWRPTA